MEHPLTIISFLPESTVMKYGHVFMLMLVTIAAIILALITKRSLTSFIPSRFQAFIEGLINSIYNLGESLMGEHGVKYIPFSIGIGFFVVVSNLIGLVPGFTPPTQNLNTTLAAAVAVFFFYNYVGFKEQGISYLKSFVGPSIILAPIMIPIEIISNLARPLSLCVRLFGNISGEEIVIGVLFVLLPVILPLPMYFLGIFTCILQAFVFMLLSMVYIGGAIEEAH